MNKIPIISICMYKNLFLQITRNVPKTVVNQVSYKFWLIFAMYILEYEWSEQ